MNGINYYFSDELYYIMNIKGQVIDKTQREKLDMILSGLKIIPGTVKSVNEDIGTTYVATLEGDSNSIVINLTKEKGYEYYTLTDITVCLDGYLIKIFNTISSKSSKDKQETEISYDFYCYTPSAFDYVKGKDPNAAFYAPTYFQSKGIRPNVACKCFINKEALKYGLKPIPEAFEKAKEELGINQKESIEETVEEPVQQIDDRTSFEDISMLRKALDESKKRYQRPEPDPDIKTSFEYVSNIRKVL